MSTIRLTQPVTVTWAAGHTVNTHVDPDGGVHIHVSGDAVVPAGGFEVLEVVAAGLTLVEGKVYDLTYQRSWERKSTTRKAWRLTGSALAWRGDGFDLAFQKANRTSMWGGQTLRIRTAEVITIAEVES